MFCFFGFFVLLRINCGLLCHHTPTEVKTLPISGKRLAIRADEGSSRPSSSKQPLGNADVRTGGEGEVCLPFVRGSGLLAKKSICQMILVLLSRTWL